MTYPTNRSATWFVTGTSRGLGLDLVKELLAGGNQVAATTRSTERLLAALEGVDTTGLLPLEVQLTDQDDVTRAVETAITRFGQIDVVVNNAGYGYLGAIEETTDEDVRQMFDVQVRGTWNVIRAVLPGMRAARSGHIINISSILGLVLFPGWGLYCAAKYAVEGLTESLAAEITEHGIQVTIVEPGYFNTDFLTSNSLALPGNTSDAYPAIREMVQAHQAMPGTQLGDPAKAAAALVTIAQRGNGPLRQQLGSDSSGFASSKVAALTADIDAGRELAFSTDYVR
ncbi:SDR family NAD(P)-dependent oxidoreductase [Curtobacterium sp. MCPF17_002]|uniref:SDR family NAD(P)-dependent oxidoreductase n=1 Tax=Curtobacterium sp. MCPF17_002 TaxID=2175645 RepID=UPI000DA9E0B9|nr:SDR family NAD(P)-dependent oxidoreductase [Curtobacterium sp. MCPF17_002]WIB77969.1 SDR family NAD(P)-dependent oxidoreductase [Curtobacterium sp. MCPF17_002]